MDRVEAQLRPALCHAKVVTDNHHEQMDMCIEVERELRVPEGVMRRVHARLNWYLLPDNSYKSLEAYIDATRAGTILENAFK